MNTLFKATPRLSRRLQLQAKEHAADGAGGMSASWVPLGTLWAAVDGRSGREAGRNGVMRSAVTLKITVRAAPAGSAMRPQPDQRFVEGARHYQITAVTEADAKGRYLTCYAKEEVAT